MDELKSLKEKMLAIKDGNFDIEAPNRRVVKCWERLNCDQRLCPAYGRLRCWSIAGTLCHNRVQGVFARKLGDCRKCVVYKESCGDEISELLEIFNQMVKDIKFNIKERERVSQEKARGERLAELGDLIATVAHETRNPLHAIGLAANYMKKNFHNESDTALLTVIEEEVSRLSDLTTRFLHFSQPLPLQLEPCDLNAVVVAEVDSQRRAAASKNLSLNTKLANLVPGIISDQLRVGRALAQLLDNAVAASRKNGIIRISTMLEKDFIRISVQDDGPGIAPEEQDKIFQPFYTTKTQGAGLGLTIAQRSLTELCGRIELDSAPGRGATFSLLLPL